MSVQRICSEFETIKEVALKVPENTGDIIQLIEYINCCKTKGLAELKEKTKVNRTIGSHGFIFDGIILISAIKKLITYSVLIGKLL